MLNGTYATIVWYFHHTWGCVEPKTPFTWALEHREYFLLVCFRGWEKVFGRQYFFFCSEWLGNKMSALSTNVGTFARDSICWDRFSVALFVFFTPPFTPLLWSVFTYGLSWCCSAWFWSVMFLHSFSPFWCCTFSSQSTTLRLYLFFSQRVQDNIWQVENTSFCSEQCSNIQKINQVLAHLYWKSAWQVHTFVVALAKLLTVLRLEGSVSVVSGMSTPWNLFSGREDKLCQFSCRIVFQEPLISRVVRHGQHGLCIARAGDEILTQV